MLKHTYGIEFVLSSNQKEKFSSEKVFQKISENEHNQLFHEKEKFAEISTSLAYYLKSFSNIQRFLDYISLIFKHTFNNFFDVLYG